MFDLICLGNHQFQTKIAISEQEQAQGLMFVYNPTIMSFPFKKAEIKKFWMKNTKIPLDIVFCAKNKIISIEKGIPNNLSFVGPDLPINLVVELPFGICKKNNVGVGDKAYIKYSVLSLSKKFNYDLKGMINGI